MDAREYLEEIGRQRSRIDALRKEIDDLRESINLLPGVTYDGVRVQTSTTDDKVLQVVRELVDKERRIAGLIEEYQTDRETRIMVINRLKDKDQITVLHSRYVAGMYWWEIMRNIGASESTVLRIHRDALEKLEEVLG